MQSPLFDLTQEQGAEYSTYSSWEMPAHYGDIQVEHQAAHSAAVLRDTSHWGRICISGKDHLDLLHRMSTNDFATLQSGSGFEAVLPDNRGRILELGIFYRDAASTLAILSPPGREQVPAWLDRYIFSEDITLEDITPTTAMIDLSGPRAVDIVSTALDIDLRKAANHHLLSRPQQDEPWLMRLDFSGHAGLRVIGPIQEARNIWLKLRASGARPMGEEAFEILRIEVGIPLYERELTEDHNPWEAGLNHVIHMDKGCYIGQEVIARLNTYDKVKQHLMGLKLPQGALPTFATPLEVGGRAVGKITSATYSPRLRHNIALAYVRSAHCNPGTAVDFSLNGTTCRAEIIALPFISRT